MVSPVAWVRGTVTNVREIVIQLEALAGDQYPISIQAVIDTGFNGFLTLPIDVLNALGASAAGTRRAELGDGDALRAAGFDQENATRYVGWVRGFILFHDKRSPQQMGPAEVDAYLNSAQFAVPRGWMPACRQRPDFILWYTMAQKTTVRTRCWTL